MAKRAWRYWEPTFQADQVCEMNPVWPWGGHRRFAYDLVRWMRPARIAELGVHWGTSFFTFAQAIKDGRMKETELIGVDTFEGEDHAGHYGPEVLEAVRKVIRGSFPKQRITLHRMLFRDALPKVKNESVDLLHIDGLHTFEAVKDDFDTWLPKLAPEGIVLFHDVAPDTGYGSTEYWNQIIKEHPGFAFEHSWGLGVLFPKGESRLEELRADGLGDKLVAYPALARAERSGHELRDLGKMARERLETVNKQGETILKLREELAALKESSAPKQALEQARKRAEAAEQLAKTRRETVEKQAAGIRQRDERIASLTAQVQGSRELAAERQETVKQAVARATRAEAALEKLEARVTATESTRDEVRARNAKLREILAARDTELRLLREQAGAARKELADRLDKLAELAATLAHGQQQLDASTAEKLRGILAAVDQARKAGEATTATLGRRLSRLDTDAELLAMRTEHLEEVVSQQRDRQREAGRSQDEPDWLVGQPQPPTKARGGGKSERL